MGLGFDGIVLLKLGFQSLSKTWTHGSIQNASDANLTHLCGF